MIKATTYSQYCAVMCPNERNYFAVMEFLALAGAQRSKFSNVDEPDTVEYNGVTLYIGKGALYALNKSGTKIDNLLDKKCKLDVIEFREEKKVKKNKNKIIEV